MVMFWFDFNADVGLEWNIHDHLAKMYNATFMRDSRLDMYTFFHLRFYKNVLEVLFCNNSSIIYAYKSRVLNIF